ncbi:hypothetical protein FACS189450_10900 [Spirochaetia bacterium]|nr:hypothetical protein FACS189450_10900 [Spirochaetia bacterium]
MRFNDVPRTDVTISDRLLTAKEGANQRYMLSLDSEAMLLNYKAEAVLPVAWEGDAAHGGWESPLCQLRGHFPGHWLSAAAMWYASTGDVEMKAKADVMISCLAACQRANGGEWAASIPEKYLYRIAAGERVWAPHYTIHKTFMGLLDMYKYAGNQEALDIAINWSKWFLRWTAEISREQMDNILDVETGGMLEIWAELYGITKNEDYRILMEKYYRGRLFEPLRAGEDVLTNMHANTTIPEVLGAARAYEVTGEKKYLDIVTAYWKSAVTDRGQYATGGQTAGEIWSPKKELATRLGDKNQEHCTVYNMMRLADFLIRETGDKAYADYWEQNLYNGILAQGYWKGFFTHGNHSDYPDTGLLTYFLPLRAGGRKAWSSPTRDFFCCHGTLVQANASFNRGIYYTTGYAEIDGIAVCQFFDSELDCSIKDVEVRLTQKIDTLTGHDFFSSSVTGLQEINRVCNTNPHNPNLLKTGISISCKSPVSFQLRIRSPWWLKGQAALYVNGTKAEAEMRDGYIFLQRTWDHDTIDIEFPREITLWPLPDKPDIAAFLYGPVVLAGLCDTETRLTLDPKGPGETLVPDNEREWGSWMNTFKTTGQDKNIRFIPIYAVGYEPYTVYFPIA